MKLNNRGFTVIELILSFAFVMLLAVGMFALVNNYRAREEKESVKRDLMTLKNTLTADIYGDTVSKKVKNMEYCRNASSEIIDSCIIINFMDDTSKQLEIKTEKININEDGHSFSFDGFNIIYGKVKYDIPDPKFTSVISDSMLTYTTSSSNIEYGVIYKINLRIKHQDINEEFVINIVTTGVS